MAKGETQKELIAEATRKAVKARDKYADSQLEQLLAALKSAEKEVKTSLLGLDLEKGKIPSKKSQERLQKQIKKITTDLNKNHTLIMTKAVKTTYKQGMYDGIDSLVKGKLPDYADLTDQGIKKLSNSVFSLVDTNALDFLTNFNVQLAGEVSRELADGIMQKVQLGIASGKDVTDIVKDLGGVITDKEAFKQAGKRTFKTAQQRMTLIARTEVIRAHNQGQIKFYERVGVKKFIWQTADDERTCPVCQPLDNQVFELDKTAPPIHPACRCSQVPEIPDKLKIPNKLNDEARKKRQNKKPETTEKPGVSKLSRHERDIDTMRKDFLKNKNLIAEKDTLFGGKGSAEHVLLDELEGGWMLSSTNERGMAMKLFADDAHKTKTLFDGRYLDDHKALKKQVKEKFDIWASYITHRTKIPKEKLIDVYKKIEAYHQAAFQQEFGNKMVTVYRGVGREFFTDSGLPIPKSGSKTSVLTDSLSSWTTSPKVARHFADNGGVILKTQIRVEDIALRFTGFDEDEVAITQKIRKVFIN